jgi:FkbM family methyltransferase
LEVFVNRALFAAAMIDRVPSGIARRFKRGSLAATLLRPLINHVVPDHATEVTVLSGCNAGMRLEIYPRSEKYYWIGSYELEVQNALVAILTANKVFWDVGAHCGYHTGLASRLVGAHGQVVAFEPLPANLTRLRRAIAANDLTNVTVRPAAISDRAGAAIFHRAANSSMGSLQSPIASTSTVEVEATTLDLELRSLRPPSVVKLDIEGGEIGAFRGGTELFTRVRPVVIVEFLTSEGVRDAARALPTYRFRALDGRNYIGEASNG